MKSNNHNSYFILEKRESEISKEKQLVIINQPN